MKFIYSLILFLSVPFYSFSTDSPPIAPSVAVSHDEEIAGRFSSLFHSLSVKNGFNGNVLVSQQGRIIYESSFGYSDLRKRTPLNVKSSFQIASVSKQFTAMAIMILYDEGKIDFDDTIQKYFPRFPYPQVTIRHLLSHRSGLPDYMALSRRFWGRKKGYMTNGDVMKMLVDYGAHPDFAPDAKYKYSNTGYVVLAALVEELSKMPFDRFMSEHIFAPLEMQDTFVYNPMKHTSLAFATKGYTSRRIPVRDDRLDGVVGDKGIYSTVEDMFKWDQGLYTEKLVKQSTLEKAFTPESYDYKNASEYGFGWRIENLENGEKIVFHTGWWGGYNSLFVRRLADHTAIVVLSNKVNWSFCNIDKLMKLVDVAAENTQGRSE
ncbi:MAG TPA: serine hydrolase domain-containing protein [Spirochaetota bacterium]